MKELKIKLLKKKTRKTEGLDNKNTDVYFAEGLDKLYARKGLCLKIFKHANLERMVWGANTTISEATIIQNLYAMKGLAPRVYDLVLVNGKITQVTDFIEEENPIDYVTLLQNEDKRCKLHREPYLDYSFAGNGIPYWDFINGKLVDFEGISFKGLEQYRTTFKRRNAHIQTEKGGISMAYQTEQRDTKLRLEKYQLKNLKGKTVLDVGCNLGMFSRYAQDKGAKRVVGLDTPVATKIAEKMSYLDGYFNIDYYGLDLAETSWEDIVKLTGIKKFGVIFYFAMTSYLGGDPKWLENCNTLYYESHRNPREGDKREFYEKRKGKIIRRFFWENY